MAKPWLLFGTGLITGLALACGVYALRPVAPAPAEPVVNHRPKGHPQPGSVPGQYPPGSSETHPGALGKEIARLRRWTEGQELKLTRKEALEILADWSAADPKAALRFVLDAKRFPGRNEALAYPLAELCRHDAAPVIAWLMKNQPMEERGAIATTILRLLQSKHPVQAWELAKAQDMPIEGSVYLDTFSTFAKLYPQEALKSFPTLTTTEQAHTASFLAAALYASDPAAAYAWCESQRSTPNGSAATAGLLHAIVAADDPAAAAALVKRFPMSADLHLFQFFAEFPTLTPQMIEALLPGIPAEVRGRTITNWASDALERDPSNTIKAVKALVSSSDQLGTLSRGFSSWLDSDRNSAMAWLDTLNDPALAAGLRKLTTKSTATTDPKGFLAQMDGLGTPGPENADDINRALIRMANEDPMAGADWIRRHPGQGSDYVVNRVLSEYLGTDATAAASLISTLPTGPIQDNALALAAGYWTNKNDLPAATRSMDAISDPSQRMATMFSIFAKVSGKDSAAALRWAEAQGLSEETRITWLAIAKKGGGEVVDLIE